MSETINLRRFRRAKERAEKEAAAAANRARHGRTKAERQRDAAATVERDAHLDRHKRDPD